MHRVTRRTVFGVGIVELGELVCRCFEMYRQKNRVLKSLDGALNLFYFVRTYEMHRSPTTDCCAPTDSDKVNKSATLPKKYYVILHCSLVLPGVDTAAAHRRRSSSEKNTRTRKYD